MKFFLILSFLIHVSTLPSQRVINKEISVNGNIHLTESITVPKINRGYTLWLPDKTEAKGMVVFTHARRDTINSDEIIDYALSNQLAVLYTTTDNRLEFFFYDEKMQEIENYIQEVTTAYDIPKTNLLYCGMSLEGTRALKLAIYGKGSKSKYKLTPRAIAICDAPLDMVRFYKEMVKAKNLNFTSITSNEGAWVSGYLEKNLNGTPIEIYDAYVNYSPYCYAADGGPNIDLLKGIAIRCYTEPDVNWWIETRRKDFYSMNAIDLAALVNELKIRGSKQTELVITHDQGYHPDGSRHPHSWSIVDEKELIDWFIGIMK